MKRHVLDKKILKDLSQKNMWQWLDDAGVDWVVIIWAFTLFYIFPNFLTGLLALLIIGNRQHALAILGHDGTHYTLSRNKKYNDFLTNMFSFWSLGLTVSGYRSLHYKHHKHTGTEDDPELAHKRSRSPQWDLPSKPSTILKYAMLDIVGLSIPDYWIVITYSKPDSSREYLPLVCWHLVAVTTLISLGLWWVAALWYLGLITTFMMFFRLRLWLEHQGTSETHRLYLNFWQAPLLAPHNSWMHWEHHNWPSVPYHKLHKIREHVSDVPVITLADLLTLFQNSKDTASGQIITE